MAAEKLRDLSQPMDVALLDATVAAFYGTGSKEEARIALTNNEISQVGSELEALKIQQELIN
ncbi:hypothetical protein CASFOL_002205 [Castilleja foliolosa]|uniref:Uncharacterized protein n=1 Tax=Castilleja foliolosa TaxID=1961234 RepID=A0ABD3EH69_9LAMI